MRVIVALSLIGAALAGCTPYAQRVARTCEGYGFSPGTDRFLSCVQGEEANDSAQRAMGGQMMYEGGLLMQTPRPVMVYRGY